MNYSSSSTVVSTSRDSFVCICRNKLCIVDFILATIILSIESNFDPISGMPDSIVAELATLLEVEICTLIIPGSLLEDPLSDQIVLPIVDIE